VISYEIGILGDVTADETDRLSTTLNLLLADFDLVVGDTVMVRTNGDFRNRNTHAATVAAYFGGTAKADQDLAQEAVRASIPVIPTIPNSGDFGLLIPDFLQPTNGLRRRADDPGMFELATALLECVGLLRQQRRIFVSYRRVESRSSAVQLHDALSARGFEVFLDTHDIRPGEPFQEVLWHRLCDSDVMIMLDTPTYFERKWTRQELGRARAKEIHILRVVWPSHTPPLHTGFAETIYLDSADLIGPDGPMTEPVIDRIALTAETLRSRSIAARHMSIAGKLRAEVAKIGGEIQGIGLHRALALKLVDGSKVWAYPVVGIPTAELLNDVANKAQKADHGEVPILFYDHVGIRDQWKAHLQWLDDNIACVRAVPVVDAGWALAVREVNE
jgi:hypothetical protein